MRGIEQQFLALQKGFTELIPPASLRPFDERELELVISGIGKIYPDNFPAHLTRFFFKLNQQDQST